MADEIKQNRIREIIKNAAAKFLEKESNGTSLITVTDAKIGDRGTKATVFFTVLPEEAQESALEFAKRQRSDFREFLKSQVKIMRLPFIDFEIDYGEKHRQKIDEISNKIQN
jgi:ribosome-binding factor A